MGGIGYIAYEYVLDRIRYYKKSSWWIEWIDVVRYLISIQCTMLPNPARVTTMVVSSQLPLHQPGRRTVPSCIVQTNLSLPNQPTRYARYWLFRWTESQSLLKASHIHTSGIKNSLQLLAKKATAAPNIATPFIKLLFSGAVISLYTCCRYPDAWSDEDRIDGTEAGVRLAGILLVVVVVSGRVSRRWEEAVGSFFG